MKDWNGLLSLTIVLPFTIPQIAPSHCPALQTAHCHYTLHTVTTHFTSLEIHYTLHATHCTLHPAPFTLYTAHYTMHTAHCTLPSTQYTYSTLHATSCTLKYYYLSMYCLFVKHNWSFLTNAWEARELGEGNSSYWKLQLQLPIRWKAGVGGNALTSNTRPCLCQRLIHEGTMHDYLGHYEKRLPDNLS